MKKENEIPIIVKEIGKDEFSEFVRFLKIYLFPDFSIHSVRELIKNSKWVTFKLRL